ncbi:hypothetical protein StoSoilB5_46060 [Arthrobacter sp. StoSoilB5]|nr:hypothetical protein StoSoilB5_46060 [Arthrobacter sp. StoSoilB5]
MADEGEGGKGHGFHCAFPASGPQFRASRKENVRRREVAVGRLLRLVSGSLERDGLVSRAEQ